MKYLLSYLMLLVLYNTVIAKLDKETVLKYKIKSYEEKSEWITYGYEYDKLGNLIIHTRDSKIGSDYKGIRFYEKDLLVKEFEINYNNDIDSTIDIALYSYDNRRNIIKEIRWRENKDDSDTAIIDYVNIYSSDSVLKEIKTFVKGQLRNSHKIDTNEVKQKLDEIEYAESKYNEYGLISEMKIFDKNKILKSTTNYEYYENGLIKRLASTSSKGEVVTEYVYTFYE